MQNEAKVFKALSSEQRLKIVEHLLEVGEYKCYCELEGVIDKDQSVIYRHFQALRDSGIIETRKKERRVEGRVKDPDKIKKILEIAEVIKNES